MSLRYIGSKARIADQIAAILGPWPGRGRFVDAFCGTGIVARHAADLGWPVLLNDHLASSVAMASAQVVAGRDVPFTALGGYQAAAAALDALAGAPGFVWREYSPASLAGGVERRYFTEPNAARIDAIRGQIATWESSGVIPAAEARLLVADLLAATNRVANIAGTYGCFLRHWTANACQPLRIAPRVLRAKPAAFDTSCLDVFEMTVTPDDTVYLDPPYTKRQYAAYYHILETIAAGDSPLVSGITGLRSWEHKASPFCYKTRALNALISLVDRLPTPRILLSYSDEGHIRLSDLRSHLAPIGDVHVHEVATIGRYRPNERASANRNSVSEYVLEVWRGTVNHPPRATGHASAVA
jgi:adenine-specific DNA-methyltransferase